MIWKKLTSLSLTPISPSFSLTHPLLSFIHSLSSLILLLISSIHALSFSSSHSLSSLFTLSFIPSHLSFTLTLPLAIQALTLFSHSLTLSPSLYLSHNDSLFHSHTHSLALSHSKFTYLHKGIPYNLSFFFWMSGHIQRFCFPFSGSGVFLVHRYRCCSIVEIMRPIHN